MKTYSPKPEHIERRWYVVDAGGQVLGRLASHVALLLRGKHKPIFAPHMDVGDHVIVVNASKVELTRDKEQKKVAYRHSGYPGGIKATSYTRLLAEKPQVAVEKAVRGMLPKNRLGRQMIGKLHVVAGPEHPHAAQKPVALLVGERPAWEGLPDDRQQAPPAPRRGPAPADEAPGEAPVLEAETPEPARKSTAKKSTAKKSTAKATTAKTTAKKTTAKKSAAKKSTAKKTTAKATTAKKATAKKSTAKKSTARSTPAKTKE